MDNFFGNYRICRVHVYHYVHAHWEIFFFFNQYCILFFWSTRCCQLRLKSLWFPLVQNCHNASCLYLYILHNCCLRFLLERLYYPGEIGNNGYAIFFFGGWGRLTRWNMVYVEMVSYHLYYMHIYYYHIKCYYFNHYYCCYCSAFVYYRTGA